MLLVPMVYEEQVRGVIVVSARARTASTPDDETTLSIFAASAAQALINAANLERLHRQQAELEHQLEGQRRLLEVNERLLSTLDASGVLDLIADSLKAIVPYDSLTVYRVDRARQRPPRRHRPRPLRRDDPRPRERRSASASPAGSSTTARPSSPTRRTSIRAPSRSPARRSSPSR